MDVPADISAASTITPLILVQNCSKTKRGNVKESTLILQVEQVRQTKILLERRTSVPMHKPELFHTLQNKKQKRKTKTNANVRENRRRKISYVALSAFEAEGD